MNKISALFIAGIICLANASATIAKDVQIKGYTKKDGTKVAGYTKAVADKKAPDTIEVKGYTKKDGTKVAGYTRKKKAK